MSILIVDDEQDIRELVGDILRDEGYGVRLAANADDCMAAINVEPPALMILDIWLKDSRMDGIDILKAVKRDNPDIPVVIISGHGNIEIAVAAIKQGAYDFIEKPFNIDQLMVVVARAMEASRLRRENQELRNRDVSSSNMIGSSPAFRALKASLDKVTKTNARVMLEGEPGSGKEMAARYIHMHSARAAAPFITVSSASVEPERMEEVLFGRETPERGVEHGLLEQAHGGIVYFDEIGDMPLGTQSKILRVLTEQQFTRSGGTDKVRVDLRVISSTSRNLRADIELGRFRQELYDRLTVIPIPVPPLTERREDIGDLARHFIDWFHRTQGLPARALADGAEAALRAMPWPGNIRQLRNIVERVLILGDSSGPIEDHELPGADPKPELEPSLQLPAAIAALALREARELFEREYLLTQIKRFAGNISKTSSFVGMERSALHRKLKSLGLVGNSRGTGRGFVDFDD
jgi:two-component system nitrogen regulation response regulator NtrX